MRFCSAPLGKRHAPEAEASPRLDGTLEFCSPLPGIRFDPTPREAWRGGGIGVAKFQVPAQREQRILQAGMGAPILGILPEGTPVERLGLAHLPLPSQSVRIADLLPGGRPRGRSDPSTGAVQPAPCANRPIRRRRSGRAARDPGTP